MSLHPIRTLLADDHALLLDMLRSRLEIEAEFRVVAATASGDAALAAGIADEVDLCVLDIDMPGLSTFEVVRRLRHRHPRLRAMFLSAFVTDAYVEQALAVGASAYLTKSEPPENVVAAMRAVMRGRTWYSTAVRERLLVDVDGVHLLPTATTRAAHLTDREREVLVLLAQGLSKKEMARSLEISLKTVDHHVAHLMEKLDLHDRVDLARFAIREGLARP